MPDRYDSFTALQRDHREGRDFVVALRQTTSPVAIIAPHGGGIEPGTTEIADAAAGAEHCFYSFVGLLPACNAALHLTSHNFDEPRALRLVMAVERVLALHGLRRETETIHLGGLDEAWCAVVARHLRRAGFAVAGPPAPHLSGQHARNICNRGGGAAGVQLEMGVTLRRQLFADLATRRGRRAPTGLFFRLIGALRGAMHEPRPGCRPPDR